MWIAALDAEDCGFGGGAQRVKRRWDHISEEGIDLENPWPGLMHADDALQALKEMREAMLLDGEVGEGGRRLNAISGAFALPICPGHALTGCKVCSCFLLWRRPSACICC